MRACDYVALVFTCWGVRVPEAIVFKVLATNDTPRWIVLRAQSFTATHFACSEFGPHAFQPKAVLSVLPPLFDSKDVKVRDTAKKTAVS